MRAELPWNVAGIPPEAREAVRAAARREGLSVGEWLTRRILSDFSGSEEAGSAVQAPQEPANTPSPDSQAPVRAVPRNGAETLAVVGGSEAQPVETWRRVEEQLRGIGRRLDSSERNHSESNRFLSRTAQEMNVNAREQAQAFDQLGQNVRSLRERLERLERSAVGDNVREAIKALHLGLSRLADQLTASAGSSASQLAQVTANLEKLASHVGKVWEDADNTAQLLEQRIDLTQGELARLENGEQALDARLSATEKTVQFNTNALDHALEKIETAANAHAIDMAASQRRAAQHEDSVRELKHALIEMEARLPGAMLEARLKAVETTIQDDPARAFDDAVRELSERLERLEKDHAGLIEEFRAKPAAETLAMPETASETAAEIFAPEILPEPLIAAPLTEEAAAEEPLEYQPSVQMSEAEVFSEQEPVVPAPFPALDMARIFPQELAAHHQDDAPHDFAVHAQTPQDIEPYPEFDDVFVEPQPDHFLAQARLSAQAASERAESERVVRLSSFHAEPSDREEKARPRYLIPALVAALVVIMAGTALMMSQRARAPEQMMAAAKPAAEPVLIAPPASVQASALPLPQPLTPADTTENNLADDVSSIGTQAKSDAPPAQSQQASAAPVAQDKSADAGTPGAQKISGSDRVALLANGGNPVALTILGLKALDAGTAARLPDAIKFLTQAADKGQAVAQYRLGTMYERGQGIAADSAKAIHWYEMAAGQGNRKAMHNLAVAYASGPKRNMTESARWFAKAAALGLSDSQFNLAVLYERGEGVSQSLTDAFKWYAIAAATGDAEAKARMTVLETQLSAADRATASKLAASFRAAPLNRSANVPPEPADLGG